jgi:hypothetical protein
MRFKLSLAGLESYKKLWSIHGIPVISNRLGIGWQLRPQPRSGGHGAGGNR